MGLDLVSRRLGRDLDGLLADDVRASGLPPPPRRPPLVTDEDLAGLPEVVQRYLRAAGVVGRPQVWSLRSGFEGRFRLRPGQRYMPATARHYNSAVEVARLFWMRLGFLGVVPMVGVDRYQRGEGRMIGRLLGTLTVADGSGPEFDIGELTTFLNDAVLFAPSMLLSVGATFEAVDDTSFEVWLTDAGQTVSARVLLGDDDLPRDFVTDDRYADLPEGLVRARWSTPVRDWAPGPAGARVATVGAAIWHLSDGDFTYVELRVDPTQVRHNL